MENKYCQNPLIVQHLLECLYIPDISEDGKPVSTFQKLSNQLKNLIILINRVICRLFRDGVWHSEAKARDLLISYTNQDDIRNTFRDQHNLIMKIYDRLSHLSYKKGTWADDIDAKALSQIDKEYEKVEVIENAFDPTKLIELCSQDCHIPDDLETTILDQLETSSQQESIIDERAQSHLLNIQENLPPPNDKLLFQIQADEFGSGSELEGYAPQEVISYLSKYLEKYVSSNENNALQEELKTIFFPPKDNGAEFTINSLNEKIQASFATNKPLLIYGGWTNKSGGHAIYHELIPTSETNATFRVFNSGSGIETHEKQIQGHKLKYKPYVEWRDISIEKLTSQNFLKALSELDTHKTVPESRLDTSYGSNDIYDGIRSILGGEVEENNPEIEINANDLITSQRSGTCSWSSLMALLRTKMDINDYKRFKCDIRLQSLIDYVKVHKNNVGQATWRLVQKSLQKLCRSTVKLHKRQIIRDAYLIKTQQILSEVSKWVDHFKPCIYQRPVEVVPNQYISACVDNDLQKDVLSVGLHQDNSQTSSSTAVKSDAHNLVFDLIHKMKLDSFEANNQFFETLLPNLRSSWESDDRLSLYVAIHEIINRLSIDLDRFKNISQEEATNRIVYLGEIAQIFTKTCFSIPTGMSLLHERVQVFQKILYLQQNLCNLAYPKRGWSGLDLVERTFEDPDLMYEDPDFFFLSFPDITTHPSMDATLSKRNLLSMSSLFSRISVACKDFKLGIPNLKLALLCSDPEIIDEIEKSRPNFDDLPSAEGDAIIFTSDLLPNWLKAIRDTKNCFDYLKKHETVQLSSRDLQDNITPNYRIFPIGNHFKIEFTLQSRGSEIPTICRGTIRQGLDELFINSGKIRAFLKLISNPNIHESEAFLRTVTTSTIEDTGMTLEEFRELGHLFTRKELSQIETLEYFTKHPQALLDTDYQTIFQYLMSKFEIANSSKILGFEEKFSAVIEKNYQNFRATNQIQPAVFMLKMAHLFSTVLPRSMLSKTSVENLLEILEEPNLSDEDRLWSYLELLTQLGDKTTLSEKEVESIICGSIFFEENIHSVKSPFPPDAQKNIEKVLCLHTRQIEKKLLEDGPNQSILNHIAKTIYPQMQHPLEWTLVSQPGEALVFKTTNEEFTLYPLSGTLLNKNNRLVKLPRKIYQHPIFTKLFPKIKSATVSDENSFSFEDSNGKETRIRYLKHKLIVEQKINQKWMRYIPPSLFHYSKSDEDRANFESEAGSLISSRYLTQSYHHWGLIDASEVNQDAIIYATDPDTGEIKYQYKNSEEHWSVEDIRTSKGKTLLGKPSGILSSFEDTSYIHEWYNADGSLKLVELPRFKLSFTPSATNHKTLICDQYPSYSLDLESPVPSLGGHKNFILLKNSQGQQKILLPNQEIKGIKKAETLNPTYCLDRRLKEEDISDQNYFSFELSEKGLLYSQSREANLYLAKILTAAQEYHLAAFYLKTFGQKLSLYTDQESEILTQLANLATQTEDKSGNATALNLYADLLSLKNTISHNQKVPNAQIKKASERYEKYLNHYTSVTCLKLSELEEAFLLRLFLSQRFDPIKYLRLKELDPISAQNIKTLSPTLKRSKASKKIDLQQARIPPDQFDDVSKKPPRQALLTRPSYALKNYFTYYYKLAKNGSDQEKAYLRDSLPFLYASKNKYDEAMAKFFEVLLNHPDHFQAPLKKPKSMGFEDLQKIDTWQSRVRKTAERLINQNEPPSRLTKAIPPQTKTKENFYLGKSSNVPALPINLALPQFESLAAKAHEYFNEETQTNTADNCTEITTLLNSFHSTSPILNKELLRLKNDLSHYQTLQQRSNFSIKEGGLDKIKELINEGRREDNKTLADLEKDLISSANKPPQSITKSSKTKLQKLGLLRKVITIEDLIIYFARNDYSDLHMRNEALTSEEIQVIGNKLGTYLLYAAKEQQKQRAEKTLKTLESSTSENKDELINQLAEQLLATRNFDVNDHPAYLAFEYLSDILMRPDQIKNLKNFLESGQLNPVMEMIMGSGKSKVLLPLLGLLRADGKNLSMIIVPKPLFESVSNDTLKVLQGFSQNLESLNFNRNTKFTRERLESILDQLKTIQEKKDCLIMTSKSMQCLIIKYIEKYSEHLQGPNKLEPFPIELKLLEEILNFLKNHGRPIIDEADTVLNVLHEVNFSLGKTLPIKFAETTLISEIYQLIYSHDQLKSLAKIESNPNALDDLPVLTEKLYFEKIQEPLANSIIDRLGHMQFESIELSEKIETFTQSLDTRKREKLLNYLIRNEKQIEASQKFFDALDPEIQNILALASEQISHLLPYTLTKNCNEKYGLDDQADSPLAIPYVASQTPSHGSQFANPHITINYTYQTYMKKGVPPKIVEKLIENFQEQALREVLEKGNKSTLMETKAGELFQKLKGDLHIPFFNYSKSELEKLLTKINSSTEDKLRFINSFILPHLELSEKKISCNAHNLVDFFGKLEGFTGTLWNGTCMHHKLKPMPSLGTDAKTLSILWENSRDNAITLKGRSLEDTLQELKASSISFDMISDSGGYFKEDTNQQMAHTIKRLEGKDVVYYHKNGEQYITGDFEDTPLSHSKKRPEDRLTLLDQSHTTGADVAQKPDGVSLVTIGRNMLLRDLLQSVWRMRGLEKSQKVRFLINHEVAEIIRQRLGLDESCDIKLDSILKFVIMNQSSQQGLDNYKSLQEGFINILQRIFLTALLDEKLTQETKTKIFEKLKSFWIKPAFLETKELYGKLRKELDSEKIVEIEKIKYEKLFKELFETTPELNSAGYALKHCLNEIKTITERIKDSLPHKLKLKKQEAGDDQTVEIEQEFIIEEEQEVHLENQESNSNHRQMLYQLVTGTRDVMPFDSFEDVLTKLNHATNHKKNSMSFGSRVFQRVLWKSIGENNPLFPLDSFLTTKPDLAQYASAFSGIKLVFNVLEWDNSEDPFKLFGTRRSDIHHILLTKDEAFILTQTEASHYKNYDDYYNLTLGFNDPNKQLTDEMLLNAIKIKFLSGISMYSEKELPILEKWLKESGMHQMQKLWFEHILKDSPTKAANYASSPLKRLFAKKSPSNVARATEVAPPRPVPRRAMH